MKLWFQRRGLLEDVINTEMKNVVFTGNFGKFNKKNKGVTSQRFAFAYHPLLRKVDCIFKKHIHLLYMNEKVKKSVSSRTYGIAFNSQKTK